MRRTAAGLIALTLLLGTASSASAEIPPILRESTRQMWAAGTLGPLIGVRDGKVKVSGPFGGTAEADVDTPTQFGFYQTFGYHFNGATGPAVAIDLQEGFGDDVLTFNIVPKFVWDIQLVPGLGLYLSPMAGLGLAVMSPDCPSGVECDSQLGATLQFGVEGKLVIADRGLVFFRPFHLEFDMMSLPEPFDEMVTMIRYGIMFGGGVVF